VYATIRSYSGVDGLAERVAAGFLRDELPDIAVSAPQVVSGDVVVNG
jgi:hypothetical protein